MLYILGGPEDIAEPNGLDDFAAHQPVPVFVGDQPGAGHGGLIAMPNSEGTKVELDWLNWQFNHDEVAARTFTGPDCVALPRFQMAGTPQRNSIAMHYPSRCECQPVSLR